MQTTFKQDEVLATVVSKFTSSKGIQYYVCELEDGTFRLYQAGEMEVVKPKNVTVN